MLTNFEMNIITLLVCSGYVVAMWCYLRGYKQRKQIVTDCNQVLQDANDNKEVTFKHGRIHIIV